MQLSRRGSKLSFVTFMLRFTSRAEQERGHSVLRENGTDFALREDGSRILRET